MKTFILHIALLLSIGTLLAACSDHDLPTPATTEAGRVIIAYSTGSLQTRATTKTTEADWEDWNENLVSSLYLLVMRGQDVTVHGPYNENNYNDPQNGTYKTLETNLTVADIAECDSACLVANCPSVAGIKTLTELNAASISTNGTDPTLTYNGRQEKFVMSATTTPPKPSGNKDITLTFDLKRTAAKIALHIQSDDQQVLTNLQYRMFNHAISAYVLSREEDHNYDWLNHPEDFTTPNKDQYYDEADGSKSLIFYSYPNDWFDKEKIPEIGKGQYSIVDLHKEIPIFHDKESYILLQATYNNQRGYYKVPLNYGLPNINDKRTLNEKEYQQVRDLYRLKRNHFYQIEVNIDGEGGPIEDPVTPRFTICINDWQWGNSYQLSEDSFTEDNQTTNN